MSLLFDLAIILATGLIGARLIRILKMPDVTGYLIGGLIIGPSVLGLVSKTSLNNLGFISSIALGFIAFSIGTEFKMSYFKRVGITPIIIAIFEALTAVFLVTGTLIIFGFDKAFSIVLGAIAAATAPAATIMVIKQYKAKGPLTETLLSVVALDDAVALVSFGVAVAIAGMINNPGTGNILFQILDPIIEIISSLGIGAILGLAIVLPVRFLKDEASRQSLVYIFIFLALYLANLGGYSDLLTCMAMGAVFTNLSNEDEKLMQITDFMTPPIFMAFFVISGADLKLSILPSIGLVGIIYVVVRVIGKILGASLGAKICKAPNIIQKYLGFALLPQAGVAIGLTVVAKTVVPHYAETIRAVILCGTLIYELIGPSISKWTLKKAGEIKEAI